MHLTRSWKIIPTPSKPSMYLVGLLCCETAAAHRTEMPPKVNQRRRWYYEVTLVGASKGTRVGWARCGGAFSRGVSSNDEGEGQGTPTGAAVPSLGYSSDSWGICGHKQGKSYHQAGSVQAGRVEAAAKARRDQLKEEEEEEEVKEEEGDGEEEEGEEGERSRRSVRAGGSRSSGDSESGRDEIGDDQDGGAVGDEDQEEDTADSIFLALGGLFRDTSFVDQEREDGGNPIEYLPAAAAAAASSSATSSTTPPIPLPPPPISSSRLDPAQAPAASPDRAGVPPAPLPPPPPPPPLPPATPSRGTAGVKLPRSPFSREAESPLRPWGAGAVVGCLADLVGADGDGGGGGGEGKTGQVRLHFFLNGRPVNGNASVPIFNTTTAAATGAAAAASEGEDEWALCPAFSCASASDGVSFNLGESPFQFPPDGLIATLGASSAEGGGGGGGVGSATAAVSAAASPSSVSSSSREKRSRYGSAAAAAVDWTPHTVLGRAAERALEGAFGLEQEGRTSPSPARAHGGGGIAGSGEGREVGSPHGGSGSAGGGVARTMAEALRSPSKKSSSEAPENPAATTAGKQGRTKGIVGGVLAVKDAAMSRCVRFDGSGWAVARRPNLAVQTLDVFLLEALVRPIARSSQRDAGSGSEEEGAEGATRSGETEEQEEQEELVVLSQGGKSGFCLAIHGAKAVLCLNGPEASGEKARHATPDGVLPVDGTWFTLSVALARDTSQGMDKVPVV